MTLPMKPILLATLMAALPTAAMSDAVPGTVPGTDITQPASEPVIAEGPATVVATDTGTDTGPDMDTGDTDTGDARPDDATEAETAAEAEPEGLRILDATDIDPDEFLWEWRILAVMADTPNDPAFIRQMRDINERANELFERDVVVVFDSDRNSGSILRQRLRPRGFMLVIIDKDGEVKQRRPAPRDVREISAVIDRFPLRRQEMLERRPAGR